MWVFVFILYIIKNILTLLVFQSVSKIQKMFYFENKEKKMKETVF